MFMPPLCRLPPCLYSSSHQDLSQTYTHSLVLTATFSISTLHRGFTCVHLHNTYLTVLDGLFPRSLTTTALYSSRIGWFGSSFWSLKPRGLLSSLIQHERLSPFFMTHERSGTQVRACVFCRRHNFLVIRFFSHKNDQWVQYRQHDTICH